MKKSVFILILVIFSAAFHSGTECSILYDRLKNCLSKGLYEKADSIYDSCYKFSDLNEYDLLKWTEIKGILGDFNGAARLFCDIGIKNSNLQRIARNQFFNMLSKTGSIEIKKKAIKEYRECSLSKLDTDSLLLSIWLSKTYSKFNLYREEIEAVTSLDRFNKSKGHRLLKIAKKRRAEKLFPEAVEAALQAWKYLSLKNDKQECIKILYKSYLYIGNADSALLWFQMNDISGPEDKISAVILFQATGMLDKADSAIAGLPESVSKDTLQIRQYIFSGRFDSASSFITKNKERTKRLFYKYDDFLWRIRTFLFSGKIFKFALCLDTMNTLTPPQKWPYTSEILNCRMALQRLQVYPEALQYWGKIRHSIYTRDTNCLLKLTAEFVPDDWPDNIREFLAVTIVKALIKYELFSRAQKVINSVLNLKESSQMNFYSGIVSINTGKIEEAKSIFEDILLYKPDNLFTAKARIYLLKLDQP